MKIIKIHMRALAILLVAAVITGCAGSGHVGESWQCPIAQGTACQSVSEADPAARNTRESLETLPVPAPPTEAARTINLRNLIVWFTELFNPDDEFEEDAATAEPLFAMPEAEPPDPADETLRTKERIARIWIAPYVDMNGVYREGHWVRVVVTPAGWRLP